MKDILGNIWQGTLDVPGFRWYSAYVRRCLTSGNVSQAHPCLWVIIRWIFRFWAFVQIGRVKVVGGEHLETPGRVIFVGNHGSLLDAVVVHIILRRPSRYITAYESLQGFFGLASIASAAIGIIPVDRAHGATVLAPAIDALANGDAIYLMPEGKINPSGKFLPFKLGCAWIANGAYERLKGKEGIAIVPMHICYGRRHEASAVNFLKMGFRWRHGCTVTVLPPIWINGLPNREPRYIMTRVSDAIASVRCPTSGRDQDTPATR